MSELLGALKDSIERHHPLSHPKKRRVELVLGNDREIGRETRSQEKRVGIVPEQIRELIAFFTDLRLELSVLVLQGAGQRAGFSDGDFLRAGAEIVTLEELPDHDAAPDVVHALKEPSRYESSIPGPFCRIGALHTGDFRADGGLAGLLQKPDVAIFDGSHIGAPGTFRIPIRGRMSIFAGELAARWVCDHLAHRHAVGRVVVVGAGNAGQAAVRRLAQDAAVSEIHLFDATTQAERLARIGADFAAEPKVAVHGIAGLDHPRLRESLDGAVGVIFAVAKPGEGAPKVVHIGTLRSLVTEDAVVVDISIDEGGAILDPSIRRSWSHVEIIPHLIKAIGGLTQRSYRALPNMPRAHPKEASEAHGEAVLPYVAALLFLAAREGGAEGAVRHLARRPLHPLGPDPRQVAEPDVLDALLQDLRNGMAFYPQDGKVMISDSVADRAGIFNFLNHRKIAFGFSVPAAPVRDDAGRKREKEAVEALPEPIRDCLGFVIDRGLHCGVIFHPGVDGTRTENAERALGVKAEKVLKSLVFRADDTYIAAVCTGRKHVAEERLKELAGVREVRLATPDEIFKVTGHTRGGVPVVQLFGMVAAVYVDTEVMEQEWVYGSAGTEFAGMRLAPSVFRTLGAHIARITPDDSRLRGSERKVRKLLREVEIALESDDDAAAHRALETLQDILLEPAAGAR